MVDDSLLWYMSVERRIVGGVLVVAWNENSSRKKAMVH